MESACLLLTGMETIEIPHEFRDAAIAKFVETVNEFHKTKVELNLEEGVWVKQMTYGTFGDLLYMSWKDFVQKPSLQGIQQKTYQYLTNLGIQHPSFGKEISEEDWNKKEQPKCKYGLWHGEKVRLEYVATYRQWHDLRAKFYRLNQGKYKWGEHCFLPNKKLTEEILKAEIIAHGLKNDLEQGVAAEANMMHSISVLFHDKVMKHKGSELVAYTEEIGTKICEANFYIFEKKLTSAEEIESNSKRKIFSIVNKERKKQYISLDFRHGMMEFHDEHGVHLGEYRFTG